MNIFDRWFGHWVIPEPADFADMLVTYLSEAGIACALEGKGADAGCEGLRLVLANGEGRFVLGQLYRDYQAAMPWERRLVLEDFFKSASRARNQIPQELDAARGQIIPVIRDPFLYMALDLEEQAAGKDPMDVAITLLSPRHCAGLVYDWPEALCSIDQDQIDRWGIDFEVLFEEACENLYDRSPESGLEEVAPGLWCSTWNDGYNASRLLIPSLYRDLPVRGDLVAFTPHRDCLLLTGSEDPKGLQAAAEIVTQQMAAPRTISSVPLLGQHLTWELFALPDDHPSSAAFSRQLIDELNNCYEQQERLLEQLYDNRGVGLHVAHFHAMKDPDNDRVFSYTVWARGTPTLLPQADEVILVEQPDEHHDCPVFARLRWDDLVAHCPELQAPMFAIPPRYFVQDFPDNEEALKKHCLALA